jgi:putative hydrolases of HD superfamily
MLEPLFAFSRFLTKLGKIERAYPIPGTDRPENDVEHSYHLAMLAWYLVTSQKLDLDLHKVLRYALAHDLVEVYAGDTYVYSTDAEHIASKVAREAEAARKIVQEFPEISDMHEALHAYETKADRGARFVYALDKVVPILLIREDGGKMWREKKVTLDMLISNKAPKVAFSPEVEPYFNELVSLLRVEKLNAVFPEVPVP